MNELFLINKNNKITGFNLKRTLTFEECKYILHDIFKVYIDKKSDFYYVSDYEDFVKQVIENVNGWLKGKKSDDAIIEFFDKKKIITLKTIFKIIDYLIKIDAIKY